MNKYIYGLMYASNEFMPGQIIKYTASEKVAKRWQNQKHNGKPIKTWVVAGPDHTDKPFLCKITL